MNRNVTAPKVESNQASGDESVEKGVKMVNSNKVPLGDDREKDQCRSTNNYQKPANMVDRDIMNTFGDCYPYGVEAETVNQVHIDYQTFLGTDNSDGACNREEAVVVMEAPFDTIAR